MEQPSGEIRLIINADDFGVSPGVNRAVQELFSAGRLTSATVMAGMPGSEDAIQRAKAMLALDIGMHLNLSLGDAVCGPIPPITARSDRKLPAAPLLMARASLPGAATAIERELRAQIQWAMQAGIRPTHFDSHKHVHVHPVILDVMVRLAKEFGVPAIRAPVEDRRISPFRPDKATARALLLALPALAVRQRLDREAIAHPDRFFGIVESGRWRPESLAAAVLRLEPGTTELMVHPGYVDDELRGLGFRLLDQREAELNALLSEQVGEALREADVRLVGYADGLKLGV